MRLRETVTSGVPPEAQGIASRIGGKKMFKKLLLGAVVAVGAMCIAAAPASAQWGRHGGHGSSHGSHGNHGQRGNYGHQSHHGGHGAHSGYRSYYSGGYGYQVRRPVWHDTSHLDYHAPSIQRHGLHLHVTPGHYDVHRSGHYHR